MFDWLNNLWQQSPDTGAPMGLLSDEQLQQPWPQEQLPGYDAQGNWTGKTAGTEYNPATSIFQDAQGNSLIQSNPQSFWERLKAGDKDAQRKAMGIAGALGGGLLGYMSGGKQQATAPAPAPSGGAWAPTWQAQGQFSAASPYTPDEIAKRLYRGSPLAVKLRQQQSQGLSSAQTDPQKVL